MPRWRLTSNASPWSGQPNSQGMMMRCPEDEIGRNSVSPWTIPRTAARRSSIRLRASARRR